MSTTTYTAIARALAASKPRASDVAALAQWEYTVRHICGEISLRNRGFDVDAFKRACGYGVV